VNIKTCMENNDYDFIYSVLKGDGFVGYDHHENINKEFEDRIDKIMGGLSIVSILELAHDFCDDDAFSCNSEAAVIAAGDAAAVAYKMSKFKFLDIETAAYSAIVAYQAVVIAIDAYDDAKAKVDQSLKSMKHLGT